jgi:flagellar biosynthesis/type III secretory pathway M-ring protein FliF/YscJ
LDLSVGLLGVESCAESLAVFLLVFTAYFIAYRIRNKRFERKESERMRALKAKGAMPDEKEKGPVGNRR